MHESGRLCYRSYLLCMWCELPAIPGADNGWRASLQSTDKQVRIGFGNLDELCVYLQREAYRVEHLQLHPPIDRPDASGAERAGTQTGSDRPHRLDPAER